MKLTHTIRFKIISLAVISFTIIYLIGLAFLGTNLKRQAHSRAITEIQASSGKESTTIKQYIENIITENRVVGHVFEDYKNIDSTKRRVSYKNLLVKILEENPNILATWTAWEPNTLDSLDDKYINEIDCTQSGCFSPTYYKDNGTIGIKYMSPDDVLFTEDYYTIPKNTLTTTILDPRYYSRTQQKKTKTMQTGIIVPILVDSEFKGVVGFDISLANLEPIIDSVRLFETGYALVISNIGTIIAHPDKEMIGLNLFVYYNEIANKYHIKDKIIKGESLYFTETLEKSKNNTLINITPFSIDRTNISWALITITPIEEINKKPIEVIYTTALFGFMGIVLITIIGWLVVGQITKPLTNISALIKDLNNADLSKIKSISSNLKNEIGEIADSTYTLINWINNTSKFANEIKEERYDTEYKLLNKDDALGESLLDMRDHLAKSDTEDKQRSLENKQHIWHSDGLSKISKIISQNSISIEVMSSVAIKFITDYVDAIQGAIFIINDEDESDLYYELSAAIAYSRDKIADKKIRVGEGLVGRCVYEKLPILMNEIPQNYVKVTSGLGKSNPSCIFIVPIVLNDTVFGVVELASFNTFENYQIEFIKNICSNIASAISNLKTTSNTARLLEQSQSQSEMLASQEEEMRQNMEEMLATQEEQEHQNGKSIQREAGLNNIINSIPYSLLTIDINGNIKYINYALNKLTKFDKEDIGNKPLSTIFQTIDLNEIIEASGLELSLTKKDKTGCNVTVRSFEISNDTEATHLLLIQEINQA